LVICFYTTSGCHLCELAAVLLDDPDVRHRVQVDTYDIADADTLIEKYGERIPVLLRADTQNGLGWPFDLVMLKEFIMGAEK